MNFDAAFIALKRHEGGFTNDSRDRGNWTGGKVGLGELRGTKYGISAAAYPGLDIENLTLDQAKAIYFRDYWRKCGCDLVPDVLRFDLFDAAVNSGVSTAIKFLQKSVGVTPDGIIGPITIIAINNIDPERLFARFNGHRLDHLNDNPELWAIYGRGWAQRIADNLKAT